jgi:hypothetical protein
MSRKKSKTKTSVASSEQSAPLVSPAADIPDRTAASALRLLQRAVREGWQIPEGVMKAAPNTATRIMLNENAPHRDRLRAAEVLAAMHRDKVNAAIALDKIERLEGGQATERMEISPAIQARAREIIAKRLGTIDRPGN